MAGLVDGEVRWRQINFKQIRSAGDMEGAWGWSCSGALALLNEVFDKLGVVRGEFQGGGEPLHDGVATVDLDQGDDFVDVNAGVELFFPQPG